MKNAHPVVLTTMCLVEKDDHVLMIKRTKSDWPGYTFPGGHLKDGEDFVDGVVREVKEETGIHLVRVRLCGISQFTYENGVRYVVVFFKSDAFEGNIRASKEGEVHWVDKDTVPALDLAPDTSAMFTVMDKDECTEVRYIKKDGRWAAIPH